MVKVEDEHGEESTRLIGFITIPVFRFEDTAGEALDYEALKVPDVPLLGVAAQWGITVKAVPENARYLGQFSPAQWGAGEIRLATPEEKVFFHELSHAAHERVLRARGDTMKGGQDWRQEIVAELSAAVLCRLCGKSDKDTSGNSYRYIESYALRRSKDVMKAIASVIGDVGKGVNRNVEAADIMPEAAKGPDADDLPGKWGPLAA